MTNDSSYVLLSMSDVRKRSTHSSQEANHTQKGNIMHKIVIAVLFVIAGIQSTHAARKIYRGPIGMLGVYMHQTNREPQKSKFWGSLKVEVNKDGHVVKITATHKDMELKEASDTLKKVVSAIQKKYNLPQVEPSRKWSRNMYGSVSVSVRLERPDRKKKLVDLVVEYKSNKTKQIDHTESTDIDI